MKKTRTFISLAMALYGTCTFAGAAYEEYSLWDNFYIGANGGYLWSGSNRVINTSRPTFANPTGAPISGAVAVALAALGKDVLVDESSGGMGGVQLGYNSHFMERFVIGLEADFDGIGNSKSDFDYVNTSSPAGLGTYSARIIVHKKLDFMGTLRGRFGYLLTPSFLIYGAGGYAYGNAALEASYSITSTVFSPINEQKNRAEILSGWNVGGGMEWRFKPAWSMKLEYIYYNLGPINTRLEVTQLLAGTPPITFATVNMNTLAHFSNNAIRVGINYHFC